MSFRDVLDVLDVMRVKSTTKDNYERTTNNEQLLSPHRL